MAPKPHELPITVVVSVLMLTDKSVLCTICCLFLSFPGAIPEPPTPCHVWVSDVWGDRDDVVTGLFFQCWGLSPRPCTSCEIPLLLSQIPSPMTIVNLSGMSSETFLSLAKIYGATRRMVTSSLGLWELWMGWLFIFKLEVWTGTGW